MSDRNRFVFCGLIAAMALGCPGRTLTKSEAVATEALTDLDFARFKLKEVAIFRESNSGLQRDETLRGDDPLKCAALARTVRGPLQGTNPSADATIVIGFLNENGVYYVANLYGTGCRTGSSSAGGLLILRDGRAFGLPPEFAQALGAALGRPNLSVIALLREFHEQSAASHPR